MSNDDAIFGYLTRQLPGLTLLIGKRVYPAVLPQRPVLPAITYQQISNATPYRSQTDDGPDVDRYRLNCWGRTLEDANRIRDVIVADFKAGGGPTASNVRDGGSFDIDPATLLFRRRLEILFTTT